MQTGRTYSSSAASNSADGDEESLSEAQVLAADYHAILSDQYRADKDRQVTEDEAIKAEMRLVPAPLFFKRNQHHRRTTSHNSTGSKISGGSAKPRKARSSGMRIPNLTLNLLQRDRQGGSGSGSARTLPAAKSSPRMHPSTAASTPPSSTSVSPRTPAIETSRTIRSPARRPFVHELKPHSSSSKPSLPLPVVQQPPSALERMWKMTAEVLDKAKPEIATPVGEEAETPATGRSLWARPMLRGGVAAMAVSERGRLSGDAMEAVRRTGLGIGGLVMTPRRSHSQKRRDELKKSIRYVGEASQGELL